MNTLNFPILPPLERWAQRQIDGGKYASLGEYINALIAKDRERCGEATVLKGADAAKSGIRRDAAGATENRPKQKAGQRGVDFKTHLASAPLEGIDLERLRDPGREIKF